MISEGDEKPANLPGRVTVHDPTAHNIPDKNLPQQTPPGAVPPVGGPQMAPIPPVGGPQMAPIPSVGGPQVAPIPPVGGLQMAPIPSVGGPQIPTDPKVPMTSYHPASLVKTPAGPRGSLSNSDESGSSSDAECSNGHHTAQSTASHAPVPIFFGHPVGRYMLPVLPEGRPSVPLPAVNSQQNAVAQVASVLERPLMHAPMPQSQLAHLLTQPAAQQVLSQARPPAVSPSLLHAVVGGQEAGRESPYLDSQLPPTRSSQPEEAWPMVGEEGKPQDQSASPPGAPIQARIMFPFGVPAPNAPDQVMMHPPHIATHGLPRLPGLPPGAAPPAGVSAASMQPMFPFVIQPFPAPQAQHLEIETHSREVQTSPLPSPPPPPVMKDKETNVRPITASLGIQCTGINRRDRKTQTYIEGIEVPLLLPEDIKPPVASGEDMGMFSAIIVDTFFSLFSDICRSGRPARDGRRVCNTGTFVHLYLLYIVCVCLLDCRAH